MTQHITDFSRICLTVTDDGSLVSIDELEGLYLHWCSVTDRTPLDTATVLDALRGQGVERLSQDGVDYLVGLVLTGSTVADFILLQDFAGVWGVPTRWDVPVQDLTAAS